MSVDRLSIGAHVIADSLYKGSRLTTFEATFPRFVLAEFNTHRVFSRNSASSRAIPVWKRLGDIIFSPFVPMHFGKNKAGMQSSEKVSEENNDAAKSNWYTGRDVAVIQAFFLAGGEDQILRDSKDHPRATVICQHIREMMFPNYRDVVSKMRNQTSGVHKQHANRVLETYAWHTVIVTGTCWRNFYALRGSENAQPEIQELAIAMAKAHIHSVPKELCVGEWHLPYVFDEDRKEISDEAELARISSARCTRVSFLTHDGRRSLDEDFDMANRLQKDGHTSPFEHPAVARTRKHRRYSVGNLGKEWVQYRKMLSNESDYSLLAGDGALLKGMKGDQNLVNFVLSLRN